MANNKMTVEVEIRIINNMNKTITIDGIEYSLTPVKNKLNVGVGDIVTILGHGNTISAQLDKVVEDTVYGYVKTTYTFVHYEKK